MAFSLKKRARSKMHIASGGEDDANALGEVLHRSGKTSKSKKNKKRPNDSPNPEHRDNHDSDSEFNHQVSADGESIVYRTTCPCESHYAKKLLERDYDLTVDRLFDLLFGSNEFVQTFRQAQRFYDDTATDWSINAETRFRERTLNYKVPYESALVGKGVVHTCEKQTLHHEMPGSHYVLEAEVCNSGVKFSDTFTLFIRYCLVQKSSSTTHAFVTAQIRFTKPVYAIIKSVIERNAYSASQEGLKDLNGRLVLITNYQTEKHRLSRTDITLKLPETAPGHGRRMSRHDALAIAPSYESFTIGHQKAQEHPPAVVIHSDKMLLLVVLITGLLLLVHIYLYFKLKHMDVLVDNLSRLIKLSSPIASSKRRPSA